MVDICPQCGNYDWNKTVDEEKIICPKCGHCWNFVKLPLFVVTGASGVGKTTTLHALQAMTRDFICMDSDLFYNLMPHETEEDAMEQLEQLMAFSRDMMQCGRPTVWAMAGGFERLPRPYGTRFFSGLYVLALTCPEEALLRRMKEGRKITDPDWLQSSVDYNRYFREHDQLGGMKYDLLEIGGMTVEKAAQAVEGWLKEKLEPKISRERK